MVKDSRLSHEDEKKMVDVTMLEDTNFNVEVRKIMMAQPLNPFRRCEVRVLDFKGEKASHAGN